MADEFARISRIARILEGAPRPDVLVGIGDDAAVLAPSATNTVLTVDASVEDVHFRRAWMTFEDIGYRATVAAASDVLAMGARPTTAVAAWTVPGDVSEDELDAIARGQRAAADALGMAIVGGNLSRGPCLSLTTTVLGATVSRDGPVGAVARSGGRVGDRLGVAGVVGEAALGLVALQRGRPDDAPRAVAAFRRPQVLSFVSLAGAHAAIDVSDGLAQDVGHLAQASGVRAVLEVASLRARRAPAIEAAARVLGVDQTRCELAGGEDYAIVAAFASVPAGFDDIGFLEAGEGVEISSDGVRGPAPLGYRHQ